MQLHNITQHYTTLPYTTLHYTILHYLYYITQITLQLQLQPRLKLQL